MEGISSFFITFSESAAIRFTSQSKDISWGTVDIYGNSSSNLLVGGVEFYQDTVTGTHWIVFPKSAIDDYSSLYFVFRDNQDTPQTATFSISTSLFEQSKHTIEGLGKVYGLDEPLNLELYPFWVQSPESITENRGLGQVEINTGTQDFLFVELTMSDGATVRKRVHDYMVGGNMWPDFITLDYTALFLHDIFYSNPFDKSTARTIQAVRLQVENGGTYYSLLDYRDLFQSNSRVEKVYNGPIFSAEIDLSAIPGGGEWNNYEATGLAISEGNFSGTLWPNTYDGGIRPNTGTGDALKNSSQLGAIKGYSGNLAVLQISYSPGLVFVALNSEIAYLPNQIEYQFTDSSTAPSSLNQNSEDVGFYTNLTLSNTERTSGVDNQSLRQAQLTEPTHIHYRIIGEEEIASVPIPTSFQAFPNGHPTFREFSLLPVTVPVCSQNEEYRRIIETSIDSTTGYQNWLALFNTLPKFDMSKMMKLDEEGDAPKLYKTLREHQLSFLESVLVEMISADVRAGITSWKELNEKYKIDCGDIKGWCSGANIRDRLYKRFTEEIKWTE